MILIGLSGPAGVGKSEAAEHLFRRYGFRRTAFKAPVVAAARELLRYMDVPHGEIEDRLDGSLKDAPIAGFPGITGRTVQQAIGFEARDALDPLLLVKIWWRRHRDASLLVLESVRDVAEAEFIRDKGGFVIEIKRPGHVGANAHPSEHVPIIPDVSIWNDGPLEILHHRLDGTLDRLRVSHLLQLERMTGCPLSIPA